MKTPSHFVVLRAAFAVAMAPACGYGAGFLSDPVVTHTNGMRLASTTSSRSHNAYWQCDPGHLGYCDGRLSSPFRNDVRSLGTRHHGRFVPPPTPMGATSGRTAHTPDGLEQATSESLGVISPDGIRAPLLPTESPFLTPVAAPTLGAAPGNGGDWMNTLQTISRKMMSAPAN